MNNPRALPTVYRVMLLGNAYSEQCGTVLTLSAEEYKAFRLSHAWPKPIIYEEMDYAGTTEEEQYAPWLD